MPEGNSGEFGAALSSPDIMIEPSSSSRPGANRTGLRYPSSLLDISTGNSLCTENNDVQNCCRSVFAREDEKALGVVGYRDRMCADSIWEHFADARRCRRRIKQ